MWYFILFFSKLWFIFFFLAPYEFLHDITCLLKKPFKSQYRQAVVSRFWTTLKNLSRSDQLLVHLSSFPSNPATYTIPESIRSGMPVFYLPANSSIPVLSSRWEPVMSFHCYVFPKANFCHRHPPFFTVMLCMLILWKFLSPTDAHENYFKSSIKIYIKTAPTCFGVIAIIRERAMWAC